jgi:threonine dehydrogenase-like Zn-dependent dehydrogenase
MVVEEVPDLSPGPGQVLVETIACGICGSDLHTVDHAHDMVAAAREAGVATFGFDPDRELVMGHELSVRVLDHGPGVEGVELGAPMAAMPALTTSDGRLAVPGYDNTYPGGYCERMLLDPGALIPVPNGLDPTVAALTEPLAVGLHAVNQSGIRPGRPAVVIGAGPVGLAVVAALALAGAEPIVASDFSPTRRQLALTMGASVAIDPGGAADQREGVGIAVEALPADAPGQEPPVIFEAVGVPGMIDAVMSQAPAHSEIIVAGVCMQPDTFRPIMGIYKHVSLRFVLGWTPEEFVCSLRNLAEGRIPGEAMITDHIGLDEVPGAFRALADPDQHVKIMVRPSEAS